MRQLLDPKVDFVFKKIFGNEKHPKILISFLNAVINPMDKIISVELKETDINKDSLEDKFSRLDVKAITSNGEHINIEIQLKNENNMVKRTLYYWSRIYSEQLGEGQNYNELSRTICINILKFKYLNTSNYHSCFRLKEMETNEELTDVQELHFIEIPKLPKHTEVKDMLIGWMEFLKDPNSEEVMALEMNVEEIQEAKKELIRLSNDDKERELYERREKSNKDRTSALDEARDNGKEERNIEIAEKSLAQGIDRKTISLITGLTVEEIKNIKEQ